jgi:predicted RNase H-like HicB family nuclease
VRDPKDFSYFVLWSEAEGVYRAHCGEFPWFRAVGATAADALREIVEAVGHAMRHVPDAGDSLARAPQVTVPSLAERPLYDLSPAVGASRHLGQ